MYLGMQTGNTLSIIFGYSSGRSYAGDEIWFEEHGHYVCHYGLYHRCFEYPSVQHGLVGASGIVYMLIILSSFTNIREGSIPLTLLLVATIYIGREIISGIALTDNISQLTHIAGGLCGLFFGIASKKTRK